MKAGRTTSVGIEKIGWKFDRVALCEIGRRRLNGETVYLPNVT